jgi:hypothetical protein
VPSRNPWPTSNLVKGLLIALTHLFGSIFPSRKDDLPFPSSVSSCTTCKLIASPSQDPSESDHSFLFNRMGIFLFLFDSSMGMLHACVIFLSPHLLFHVYPQSHITCTSQGLQFRPKFPVGSEKYLAAKIIFKYFVVKQINFEMKKYKKIKLKKSGNSKKKIYQN